MAVVFVKEIPGASVSGATHWVNDRPILQLSFKYKKDDQILFSFFHEAAHILKHGKRLYFIETGEKDGDELEQEANRFASEFLIPPQFNTELRRLRGRVDIVAFASRLGIAPGIVVGRLQHDDLLHQGYLDYLKVTIDPN